MKKTMKKTSTFFKKLGNKQSSSDQSQTHTRPPLPNEFTIHNSQEGAFPSPPLPPLPPKSPTKRTSHFKSDDEHENLQKTLNDFASVYASLQLDSDITDSTYNKDKIRSSIYMKLNANKSMPNYIGRFEYFNTDRVGDTKRETFDKQFAEKRSTVFEFNHVESKKHNVRNVAKGRRTDSEEDIPVAKLEDVPIGLQLKPASPGPFSSSDDDKTSSLLSTTNPGFPSFTSPTPSRPTSIGTSQDNKSQNSLFSPGSLMAEAEEKGMSTTAQVLAERRSLLIAQKGKNEPQEETEMAFSAGSLMAAAEEKGLFNKTSRPDLESIYDSCQNPKSPKRPDKRLPEIPRTTSPPSSPLTFVSTSTDRGRQSSSIASSCYETASGSTATLHTAPPSPTTEIDGTIIGSPTIELITIPALIEKFDLNDDESTPKIHVDEAMLASPVESIDTVPGVPEERNEEEFRWAQARSAAKRCFDDDETSMKKEKVTEFLGGTKDISRRALKCYMEYFDFTGLRLDNAFRRLCAKLYIKGETQQVDRVLEAFSQRYWECNPKTVYGSADTVHAIAYSVLLLNTDLHIAEVPKKMSQKQFIRNTMATVHAQATIALAQTSSPDYEDDQSTIASIETTTTGTSATARPRRSASIRSWMSNPNASFTSLVHFGSPTSPGYSRQWDAEMESLLKEMYSAIKSNMIQQPRLSTDSEAPQDTTRLTATLSRSMSHLGHPNNRINVLRKGLSAASLKSRINGRSSSSSSGSEYDQNNVSRRSSYQTLQAALSGALTENGHSYETNSDQNLTGTEDDSVSVTDSTSTSESLELYLSGAPFAKEGLLVKKHYWEAANKRAKDNKWKETFVAVEKGELRMYKLESFGSSNDKNGSKIVGGGNWMANATLLGELSLRHTISSALPPPGYNRSRPYVLALSLSQGGLYFFQCGTAELVDEWVATCNYWAARSSKEPLTGGVSNMEYGWGRCIEPYLDGSMTDMDDQRSIMSDGKSDVRSVLSGVSGFSSDKIIISEWKAPMPPLASSTLDEESQLAALKKHMIDLENELEEHKHYREPMLKMFPSRSANYSKVTSNWEKKSQWLLHEIVKYSTYIECLENSMSIRQELRKIKAERDTVPTLTTPEDEEEEKARRRAEQRARNRESIKLLHRATWQPGDGLSLNLPVELFGGTALSDVEDD